MATGYIVWDKVGRKVLAGPFTSNSDATAAQSRFAKKLDGHLTSKSSTSIGTQITVETVTI